MNTKMFAKSPHSKEFELILLTPEAFEEVRAKCAGNHGIPGYWCPGKGVLPLPVPNVAWTFREEHT